ncbi:MAG: DnaJ domain-containing protein [Cyanobacteriota bacterium]|nr:DnaJ domain-containing protein [Cyanobacteriota bacterium]
MNPIADCYKTLGLKPGASSGEVKQAYRQLVKRWHPDNFPGKPRQQKKAEEKIKRINLAYERLKDHQPPKTTQSPKKKVDPQPYYQKGVARSQQRQYKQAIEELTKAILIDPEYIDAYLYRAFLYEKIGQNIRAEKDYNKATHLKRQQSPYRDRAPSPAETRPSSTFSPPSTPPPWNCVGTFEKHSDVVTSIAVSPDGKIFATGSYDQTVVLWQLSSGRILRTLKGHFDRIYCVAISPDGKLVASGSGDNNVKLWKVSNGQELRTCGGWFGGHSQRVLSVAFSPNKRKLVSGSADRTVKLWQTSTGREIRTLKGYSGEVLAIAMNPDGKIFASAGTEKSLKIRETSGRLMRAIRGNTVLLSATFSPDGQILAAGTRNGTIKLWNWARGEEVGTLKGHRDRVCTVAFSPDGQTLLSGSWDRQIKLWDWEEGKEVGTLNGHRDRVCALAVSPDGNTLISASADRTVKIWWANTVNSKQ